VTAQEYSNIYVFKTGTAIFIDNLFFSAGNSPAWEKIIVGNYQNQFISPRNYWNCHAWSHPSMSLQVPVVLIKYLHDTICMTSTCRKGLKNKILKWKKNKKRLKIGG
jgi:hypothetical protein